MQRSLKMAVVYNSLDNKMREDTYSYVYRGMFEAVVARFLPVHVTKDCSAEDIEADVILFWDVNSCHHIKIDGIGSHRAVKLEYMSDPFQQEVRGHYITYDMPVHKLSAPQRLARAVSRGVEHIICPVKSGYYRFFAPHFGEAVAEEMLWHFPVAPWFDPGMISLADRKQEVLANGSTGAANGAYDFRTWAHKQRGLSVVNHWISDRATPGGKSYGEFLKQWSAGIALCDLYPVVKYMEMPLAGCVTFMQYHSELVDLGFKDMESCIYVDYGNFRKRVRDFLSDIEAYQGIADAGRKLVAENYTAKHFAEFVDAKIKDLL